MLIHALIFGRCWYWWKQTSKEIKEDKCKKEHQEAQNQESTDHLDGLSKTVQGPIRSRRIGGTLIPSKKAQEQELLPRDSGPGVTGPQLI